MFGICYKDVDAMNGGSGADGSSGAVRAAFRIPSVGCAFVVNGSTDLHPSQKQQEKRKHL